MKLNNKINKKNVTVIAVILALVVAAGYYLMDRGDDKPMIIDGVNYSPPTEEEKKQAEDHKKELEKRIELENETNKNNTQRKQADVVLVSAGQYGDVVEVSSFVSNVYENGGECRVDIVQGQNKITKRAIGAKDAQTTSCPLIKIPRSEFPSVGKWSATMTYESNAAKGISNVIDFEVK